MLKCVVITPVGPGHEALVAEARASVEGAYRAKPGPFTNVHFLPLPDPEGKYGRSQRRNEGIDYAIANGFEWIFFLDADDVMVGDAFIAVAPYLQNFDAVFGLIVEWPQGGQPVVRANQIGPTTALADILKRPPFYTLQMGHFVRTKAAAAVRFDVDMDTGEDFKYYLELWKQFRCTKVDHPFFLNRQGVHSTGPRAADGKRWRTVISQVFEEFCLRNNFMISFPYAGKTVRFAMGNPLDLIHKHFIAGSFFELNELTFLQTIIPPHSTIVEVGANIGNHLVYYGLFMQPGKIIPIEPNPSAIALLHRNIELNEIKNVDTSFLGFGVGEKHGYFDLHANDNSNIGAARLIEAHGGCVEVHPLDAKIKQKVDFIKIDVEWMEMEALCGSEELIHNSRPIIFIEVMNSNVEAFHQWTVMHGYKVIKVFPYVNAKNFVAVPAEHRSMSENHHSGCVSQ